MPRSALISLIFLTTTAGLSQSTTTPDAPIQTSIAQNALSSWGRNTLLQNPFGRRLV